jgi:hypothetical protein
MANQPAKTFKTSTRFSNRIRTHSRVAQYWPQPLATSSCVFAVNDQLIVSKQLMTAQLQKLLSPLLGAGNTATVLATIGDYNLVRLTAPGGSVSKPFPKNTDIFDVTTELRKHSLTGGPGAYRPTTLRSRRQTATSAHTARHANMTGYSRCRL